MWHANKGTPHAFNSYTENCRIRVPDICESMTKKMTVLCISDTIIFFNERKE